MSDCPSCGRYTGPQDACPYCGAHRTGRLPLRALKFGAIALATVGLVVLGFVASGVEAPLVQAGQVSASMNLAYVRLSGRCTRGPSYDAQSETLSFYLDDGTGEVRIVAYRAEARELATDARVPAVGDAVDVEGTLRVQPDYLSLTVQLPSQLVITRSPAADREIGSLSASDAYQRVRVRGQVRALREAYPGLTIATLRDASGEIPVALDADLLRLSGRSLALFVGDALQVEGTVTLYRDAPQLVPAWGTDVTVLDEPALLATQAPVGYLAADEVGRLVLVQGTVREVEPFSAGVRFRLDDGTGTIDVVLWESVCARVADREHLANGATVQVLGRLAMYRNALELAPELPEDVRVVQSAPLPPEPTQAAPPMVTRTPVAAATSMPTRNPLPTPSPQPTPWPSPTPGVPVAPIGALTDGLIGTDVTVEGSVVEATSFSHGFRYTLEDATGRVMLVLWHEVYDDCWDAAQINLGAEVRASGRLSQYEGQLELVPSAGADVKALRGAAARAVPQQIGSLEGGDAGQRVTVEGQVLRVEGFESAVKVFVSDDSGEIGVYIWRNVLDRIARNAGLGTPGSRVRVAGVVETYRSNLELHPQLPADVTVLEVPQ